jgi:predicted ATP-binding protein involved in virulence
MSVFHPLLSLERLDVRNFRCFAECPLELHPKLTVLVAENGQGKTALLDAIRMGLSVFVSTLGRSKLGRAIENSDIRRAAINHEVKAILPASFNILGWVNGEKIRWCRTVVRWSARARNSTKDVKDVQQAARKLGEQLEQSAQPASPAVLPLVAFYGTGRLFDEHRLTKKKHFVAAANPVRFSAYLDCLSPSSSYKAFVAWYAESMRQVSDPTYKTLSREERPEKAITAVREAVKTVLVPTGWSEIDWEFPDEDDEGRIYGRGYLSVKHEEGVKLPLAQLSDGVRNMVALVADIAHRCVRLNPHFGEHAARLTPGVLLIDEIDMHLHPRWQQRVIRLLQEAFPQLQIIVSTHSPHVLSTVDRACIRLIALNQDANGMTPTPKEQTRGDESGNVLARAMNVDPVPDVGPARLLSEYRGLVQNGLDRSDRAQSVWLELVSHFGEGHHLLHEASVLRDLQEFKREYGRPAGGAH